MKKMTKRNAGAKGLSLANARGFSLAELMVALAIFATIIVAALMLYDRSNKMFRSGTEASDLQQNTRVAFEKVVSDLRMAGYDFDRDGIPFASGDGVAAWQPSRAYDLGAVVIPPVANGFTYVCTDDGTSGASQPTWSTTVGAVINDNTVRWTAQTGVNQFQQPDEQIEYAGNSAITFRANFDYESHKTADNGREGAKAATLFGRPNLETPQFPVVTTGNDDIVTYALHSESSAAGVNADRVQFYADVPDRRAFPGGRAENLVTIDDVDLCNTGCNAPPYTLYRITLGADGLAVRTPLASNVRGMQFQYYNDSTGSGTAMSFTSSLTATTPAATSPPFSAANPASSGGGQYNPLSPAATQQIRAERGKIQSVRIILTGLNSGRAESGYQNPAETTTSPVRNYRTYKLESLVVPRNLGKIGQREVQQAPPGPPKLLSVCIGWCGMAKVDWLAPPPNSDEGSVDQYVIIYDTVNPPVRFQQYVPSGVSGYVDGLTPGTQYFFTIAAVNGYGTRSAVDVLPAAAPGLNPRNQLAPDVPSGFTISGSGVAGEPASVENEIHLNWVAPSANLAGANSASCVSVGGGTSTLNNAIVPPAEIDGYEVWRDTNVNFIPPGQGTKIYDPMATPVAGASSVSINVSNVSFIDKTAAPCKTYYYRIRGVKKACFGNAAANVSPGVPNTAFFPATASPAHAGTTVASNRPDAPATLLVRQAPLPNPVSSCGVTCTVYLTWPKVKQDTSVPPKPMTVDSYIVTRERYKSGVLDTDATVGPPSEDIAVTDTTPGNGSFVTTGIANDPFWLDPGYGAGGLPSVDVNGVPYSYTYRVRATLACLTTPPPPGSSWDGAPSPDVRYPCVFAVSSFAANMTATVTGDGLSYGTAWQSDGSGSSSLRITGTGMQSVQVLLRDFSGANIIDLGTQTGPFDFPIIPGIHTTPGEYYQVFIIAKDNTNCIDIKLRYYQEGTASGCCLAAVANDPFVMQYSPGADFVDVFLKNECSNILNLQTGGIRITWDSTGLTAGTQLRSIDFPATAGGTVNSGNINDSSGAVVRSVPGGGVTAVAAGSTTYRMRINFSKPLPVATSPLRNVCISYQRPGIDTSNQNCRIVPQPTAGSVNFNTCN
jgi:prepilin-type N-terminal cleavage/methylation domain-containing protein